MGGGGWPQLLAAIDQTELPVLLPVVPQGSSPEGRSQTHSMLLGWPVTETRSGLQVLCVCRLSEYSFRDSCAFS